MKMMKNDATLRNSEWKMKKFDEKWRKMMKNNENEKMRKMKEQRWKTKKYSENLRKMKDNGEKWEISEDF